MSTGATAEGPVITQEEPCGPDLFETGNQAAINFTARVEGMLPGSFFSRVDGSPFDRSSVDLQSQCSIGTGLCQQTHDLRLLTLLIKLNALDRRPEVVVQLVERISHLLETHWEHVHPKAEAGDLGFRVACLQALDDNSQIILPLQHCPLVTTRGTTLSLRAILVAKGEIEPREGEERVDMADLARRIEAADHSSLNHAYDLFDRLVDAIARITATCSNRGGSDYTVRFDLLGPFANKGRETFAAYVTRQQPEKTESLANGHQTQPDATLGDIKAAPSQAAGLSISSSSEVALALSVAADYFADSEPSNPALLLIRQAQKLFGKSFLEVLRVLAPDHLGSASIQIGRDASLSLPVERLAEFDAIPDREATPSSAANFQARSRGDAVKLLGAVINYYAINEPSSPLPMLLDRARALVGRDFIGIIKDVLPEEALKISERGET